MAKAKPLELEDELELLLEELELELEDELLEEELELVLEDELELVDELELEEELELEGELGVDEFLPLPQAVRLRVLKARAKRVRCLGAFNMMNVL